MSSLRTYQRGERNGYRSGYKPEHLDTAEGRLQMVVVGCSTEQAELRQVGTNQKCERRVIVVV